MEELFYPILHETAQKRIIRNVLLQWHNVVFRAVGVVIITILASLSTYALESTVGGITWTYRLRNGNADIQDFTPKTVDVSFPSSVDGYPVTSLSGSMLSYDRTVQTVTIPSSVIQWGWGYADQPFARSYALRAIYVGAGNPAFVSEGGVLYNKAKTILCAVPAMCQSLSLPATLKSIDRLACAGCRNLQAIALPESVTSLGGSCFAECMALEHMDIPAGVTDIPNCAFGWCSALQSVNLPDGLRTIGTEAFYNCRALRSIVLPRSVVDVGTSAFVYCTTLTSIDLPQNISGIDSGMFANDQCITNIIYRAASAERLQWFDELRDDCVVRVRPDSFGWGVPIPGTWKGARIEYLDDSELELIVDISSPSFLMWFDKYGKECGAATPSDAFMIKAANPRYTLAEAYVAGIDPTNPDAKFTVRIDRVYDGIAEISYDPVLPGSETMLRNYYFLGKENLADPDWTVINEPTYVKYMRFFKVLVEMR